MRDVKSTGKSMGSGKMPKKELMEIRIKPAENEGHVVEHHFASGMGAYHEPEVHAFGKGEGKQMLEHVGKHMGVKVGPGTADATTEDEEEGDDTY